MFNALILMFLIGVAAWSNPYTPRTTHNPPPTFQTMHAAQAELLIYLVESDPESGPYELADLRRWCADAEYSAGARKELPEIDQACKTINKGDK